MTDVSIIHAPFSLLPTPMPRNQFELVTRTMPVFNSLVQSISADTEYLAGTLAQAAKFDDFTARLLDVFASAADARDLVGSPITLGIHRSDYMLDGPTQNLLQARAPRFLRLQHIRVNPYSGNCIQLQCTALLPTSG